MFPQCNGELLTHSTSHQLSHWWDWHTMLDRITDNTWYLGMWLKTQPAPKLTGKNGNKSIPGNVLSSLEQFVVQWMSTVSLPATQRCDTLAECFTCSHCSCSKRTSSIFFRTVGNKPQIECSFLKGFFQAEDIFTWGFLLLDFYNAFHCLNFLLLKRIILPCKEVFLHPCIPSVVGWIHVLLLSLAVISQPKKSPSSMFSSKTNSAKPHSSFCYSSLN